MVIGQVLVIAATQMLSYFSNVNQFGQTVLSFISSHQRSLHTKHFKSLISLLKAEMSSGITSSASYSVIPHFP